jgi:methylmalonyl-CoA mutase, N-terminal domain
LIERIDALGGAVAATEQGFMQREIEESAYETQRKIEEGRQIVVGVNKYRVEAAETVETFRIDPKIQAQQIERLRLIRQTRDNVQVSTTLDAVAEAARGTGNILLPMKAALAAYASIGEVCAVLRSIWGEHRE